MQERSTVQVCTSFVFLFYVVLGKICGAAVTARHIDGRTNSLSFELVMAAGGEFLSRLDEAVEPAGAGSSRQLSC